MSRRSHRGAALAALLVAAMLAVTAISTATPGATPAPSATDVTQPFTVLDNIEGDRIDLLLAPVRPMALSADQETLWAVNPHGSLVLGFELGDLDAPPIVHPTPWGPVSVATWTSPADGHEELLVVSRGSYGLTRMDPASGRLLGFMDLPAEPADLLVDPASGRLFVSTSARDLVLEIDLVTCQTHNTYSLDTSRGARRLAFDNEGRVVVAMEHSGNNSMALPGGQVGFNQAHPLFSVVDMADPAIATVGLPDQDLFRLLSSPDPGGGQVEVAAIAAGTNNFAHGVNPATGDHWILNTEANNKDPAMQNEPALRGQVVFNRLTITRLDGPGPPGAADHTVIVLDDALPATPEIDYYGADQSIGQPTDLAFEDDGHAYVVGMLTDNVIELDRDGQRVDEWDTREGGIPRAILLAGDLALVYNWGSNDIQAFDVQAAGKPEIGVLDLRYDPTPAQLKRGRRLFFDGHNSEHANASCNSCHPDVGMDFLVWNLSDLPVDDKGPMQTQNLRGIEPLNPYHWRGERSLLDFNPAFDGLLGGTPLGEEPGGDFEAFEAFVFSVQNPANPFADPRRVINDDLPLEGFDPGATETLHDDLSAINGESVYFTIPNVGVATCNDCHTLPTGTVNEFFHDGLADQDHRSSFDVPAYNGMWRKEQKSRVEVTLAGGGTFARAPLGSGSSHAGNRAGVLEFVTQQFPALSAEERQDVALFLHQIDSGLAPAVHRAGLLIDADGNGETDPEGRNFARFLLTQAARRNCDVAVFGEVAEGESVVRRRWFWDRELGAFIPENGGPPRGLDYFIAQAAAGHNNMLVGKPVGSARRWAVDFDNDLLFNGAEAAADTNPFFPDSDRDGFLDSTEVTYGSDPLDQLDLPTDDDDPQILSVRLIYATARVAKLIIETDEPTRLEVEYAAPGEPTRILRSAGWETLHTVFPRDLTPSYPTDGVTVEYNGLVRAFDQADNLDTEALPEITTEAFIIATEQGLAPIFINETVVRDLAQVGDPVPVLGGGYELTYTATVAHQKQAGLPPLADHVVVVRPLIKQAGSDAFVRAANVIVDGDPAPIAFIDPLGGVFSQGGPTFYAGLGPFVFSSVSSTDGVCTIRFTLPAAAAGDEVRISVESVNEVDGSFDPSPPEGEFPAVLLGAWHLPATDGANRASEAVTLE